MLKAHKIRLNPTKTQQTYFYRASGIARYAYNWAVGQWREATGGQVIEVDRFFASSKTCSSCKTKRAELSLSERLFTCKQCGLELDRDLNAAKNILKKGLRIASEHPASDSGYGGCK
jgi:putative transposase